MTFCEKEAERFLKRVNPLANKKGATYEGTLLEGARTDTNADNWYYTIVQDVCSNHWKDEEGKIPKDWYGTDATANDPAPLSMVRAALRGFSEERPKRRPLSLDYVGGAERAKRARTEIMGELEKFIRQCKRGKREKGHANYCGKSAEDVLVDAGYKWNVNEGEFENATNIAQHRPPQPRTDYPKPSVDDWNSLWRKVRDLTNMKKWIGMRTGRRGTCAGFFCDTNGNTMHGWALASRSNYKTTCRLKTKINPAEGYKLNARGVAQLKPGYYVDTKDRVAKRCTSQKGCNSDGSACATGVNKTKLKCATPSTGFYVNNAGEARACTSQQGCNSNGSACATGVNKTKLKCNTAKTGYRVDDKGVVQLEPGYYADSRGEAQECTSQPGCNSDDATCATGDNNTKLKCATPSDGYKVNNGIVQLRPGYYADSNGAAQKCTSQENCETHSRKCVAGDNKLMCTTPSTGYYVNKAGVAQACTGTQTGCAANEQGVCTGTESPQLKCATPKTGHYLKDGIVSACDSQTGCAKDKSSCVNKETYLQCETPKDGYYLNAKGEAAERDWSPREGCAEVATSGACVTGAKIYACKRPADGYYVDGTGREQKCTLTQPKCAKHDAKTCVKDAIGRPTNQMACAQVASNDYGIDDSGNAVQCNAHAGCAKSGGVCASGSTSLTCTEANNGYYLDGDVPKQCIHDLSTCATPDNTQPCVMVGNVGVKQCKTPVEGYTIINGRAVKCESRANCQTDDTQTCKLDANGNAKYDCATASQGFFVQSDGSVQACANQANCQKHEADCTSDNVKKCTVADTGYRVNSDTGKVYKRVEPDEYYDGTTVKKCTSQEHCETDGTKCDNPPSLRIGDKDITLEKGEIKADTVKIASINCEGDCHCLRKQPGRCVQSSGVTDTTKTTREQCEANNLTWKRWVGCSDGRSVDRAACLSKNSKWSDTWTSKCSDFSTKTFEQCKGDRRNNTWIRGSAFAVAAPDGEARGDARGNYGYPTLRTSNQKIKGNNSCTLRGQDKIMSDFHRARQQIQRTNNTDDYQTTKLRCTKAKPGYYIEYGSLVKQCTEQQNCTKHSKTDCTRLGGKLKCTTPTVGHRVNADGVVEPCTSQAGCQSDAETCMDDGKLKCETAKSGYHVSNGGVANACTSQANCRTDLAGACVEGSSNMKCKVPAPGHHVDASGVVQACTTQSGCNADGCECVSGTTEMQCNVPKAGYYVKEDSGVAQKCTSQANCANSANACSSTDPSKKKCDTAAAGYYVDGYKNVRKCTPQDGCRKNSTVCDNLFPTKLKCLENVNEKAATRLHSSFPTWSWDAFKTTPVLLNTFGSAEEAACLDKGGVLVAQGNGKHICKFGELCFTTGDYEQYDPLESTLYGSKVRYTKAGRQEKCESGKWFNANRQCVAKTTTCAAGSKLVESVGDTADNTCEPCTSQKTCKTDRPATCVSDSTQLQCAVAKPGYRVNSKGVVHAYAGTCANGELKANQADRTKDNDCGSCNGEFWLDRKDNTCKPWRKPCDGDMPVQETAPTNSQNRVCRQREFKDCGKGQWLDGKRVCRDKTTSCEKGFRLVESNDKNADNACKPYAGTCKNGELKAQALRTKDNDCGSCKGEFWLNKDVCEAWAVCDGETPVEDISPNNTRDRKCRKRESRDCDADQWFDDKEKVCQNKTTSCNDGFKLVESDNKKEDNRCEPYKGTCANGELKQQSERTKENHCGSCDDGYYLENDACKPFSGTCTNGELKPQAQRKKNNDCGSCKGKFWLDGDACKAWTVCSGDTPVEKTKPNNARDRACRKRDESDCKSDQWLNGNQCQNKKKKCSPGFRLVESGKKSADNSCKPFAGTCANGELKPQAQRTKDNDCGSCKGEYFLDGDACKAWAVCRDTEVEKTKPSNTRDRKCRRRSVGDCKEGEYFTGNLYGAMFQCRAKKTSCAPGFGIIASNSDTEDNKCRQYYGSCANGELKPKAARTRADDCGSCNRGFKLDGSECKPFAGTCANGQLKESQSQRVRDNDCGSCNPGFRLASDGSCAACPAGTFSLGGSATSCTKHAGPCSSTQYEARSPRPYQDRQCRPLTQANSNQYINEATLGNPKAPWSRTNPFITDRSIKALTSCSRCPSAKYRLCLTTAKRPASGNDSGFKYDPKELVLYGSNIQPEVAVARKEVQKWTKIYQNLNLELPNQRGATKCFDMGRDPTGFKSYKLEMRTRLDVLKRQTSGTYSQSEDKMRVAGIDLYLGDDNTSSVWRTANGRLQRTQVSPPDAMDALDGYSNRIYEHRGEWKWDGQKRVNPNAGKPRTIVITPCTDDADRVNEKGQCATGKTQCEYEATPPSLHKPNLKWHGATNPYVSDRTCATCGAGHQLRGDKCQACAQGTFSPDSISDCKAHTAACSRGQFQSTAPTSTQDRVCTDLTSCGKTHYEFIPPTLTNTKAEWNATTNPYTTDRQCKPLTQCSGSSGDMEIVKPSPKNSQAAWNALTNPFANRACGHIIGNVRNCAAKGQIYDTAAVACRSPKNEAECLQTAITGTMTKKSKWNGSECVAMCTHRTNCFPPKPAYWWRASLKELLTGQPTMWRACRACL